ncbi:hypothetical protein GCM10010289_07010 [Streptomyces violascens]|uniref:Methyltransferase type 11 domain-containing protein n=1 Tax=Streptomyces violascens TaxID=67381 RepID=A0ABQ3QGE4_9ACTN|nr:hypothetical protein GCM10010289_07010 [Streptomyces violascens]GHI36366.1 hypothetical protein Sviol_07740 [Streptomyces violascens]
MIAMTEDEAPSGPFDFVHARLVLVHVKDRDRALRAMLGAQRPGGRRAQAAVSYV